MKQCKTREKKIIKIKKTASVQVTKNGLKNVTEHNLIQPYNSMPCYSHSRKYKTNEIKSKIAWEFFVSLVGCCCRFVFFFLFKNWTRIIIIIMLLRIIQIRFHLVNKCAVSTQNVQIQLLSDGEWLQVSKVWTLTKLENCFIEQNCWSALLIRNTNRQIAKYTRWMDGCTAQYGYRVQRTPDGRHIERII